MLGVEDGVLDLGPAYPVASRTRSSVTLSTSMVMAWAWVGARLVRNHLPWIPSTSSSLNALNNQSSPATSSRNSWVDMTAGSTVMCISQ